ncbi:MAG: peptidylprolyl isomerase [Pirellula sp.]
MRHSIHIHSTAIARKYLALVLLAPIALLATSQSGEAQNRPANNGTQNKTVPATAASTSKTIAEDPNAPKVVAAVNGIPISISELAHQCRLRFGEDVLEDLVNKTLILQACQAQNVTVTQKDIDDEIGRTASKFNLSVAMYLKLIEDERDIKPEQYASDIIWPMIAMRRLSKDKIAVSPQEIDRAFQSEFGPKVQVRMIACKDPQKIAHVRQNAMANPAQFKTLAKTESEDPSSASVEGLLPLIRRFTGDDELEQIAFGLQPDQISQVFKAGEMHVVLQCVKHIEASNPPASQMQEIQNRIRSEIEDVKLRGMAEEVYTQLRSSSNVIVVSGNPEMEAKYPDVAAIVNNQSVPKLRLEQALVKRHGSRILDGEINRKLIEEALRKAGQQVTQADIDQELVRAAEYFGFVNPNGTPNIQDLVKHVQTEDGVSIEVYVRDAIWPTVALKKLIGNKVQVTEEDLKKGFESNYGQRAEVLAIVMASQRTAQSVWEMARADNSEKFFGDLANKYSVEPSSKSNYGKVPPLRRFGGQPNLEKAAFELKPGEMSGIIEVGGQFVILKSQGLTTPVVADLNRVRDELYKDILEKKQRIAIDEHMSKLFAEAQIANFLNPKKSRAGKAETQAALDVLKQESPKRP